MAQKVGSTVTSQRYLMKFSYIGTNYQGIQKDPTINTRRKSISNVLEESLSLFNKRKQNIVPIVRTASRTDIGVHALVNAATFDTVQDLERKGFDCASLRKGLNHYMLKNEEQIQVNEVLECQNPWFDCRSTPQHRTYLYKVILCKDKNYQSNPLYLFNQDRAWVLPIKGVDIDKISECADLFIGRHYLKNFVRVNTREPDPLNYYRTINSIKVHRQFSDLIIPNSPFEENYVQLGIEINAKAFLWNQIRILVFTLLKYSLGEISKDQINWLLKECNDSPILENNERFMKLMAPAGGLYLVDINYDPKHFNINI
ncbi:hypothetical protein FGO68_gene726 [Halteria grandinella]|uniref:tRNA pseudouridine synthase n=1 Tax=Halteria grandinella TaxID=5974 RepID=A0A8J8SZT5_HALGN|nr:hypothetical protein FGO68_gene726 [Halteria grandinella]